MSERQATLHNEHMRILKALVQDLRARLATAEAVLSVMIETVAGGEVITPNSALKTAKPIQFYSSGDGRDDELTVVVVYP